MSRTPVREAIFSLEEDHLVKIYGPNKTVVSLISWNLIEEGKFVRSSIESSDCGGAVRQSVREVTGCSRRIWRCSGI
jgi:DNA-binding GntR family transcriptional regulator